MDYFELIEEYKKDKLPIGVKESFEKEVARNQELRKALYNHDTATEIFDLLIEEDIRRQVKLTAQNNVSKVQKDKNIHIAEGQKGKDNIKVNDPMKSIHIKRNNRLYYVSAALILALVVFTLIMRNELTKNSPERIFASYYTTYPNLESPTRAIVKFTNIQEVRNGAYSAYDQEDYEEVVSLFLKLTPGYTQELSDNFYLGLSYLEIGEWENAAALFEYVSNSNSEYKNDAKWYLGLSYLRMDECTKAKEIFIPIRDAGLDRSIDADKIIDRIICEK